MSPAGGRTRRARALIALLGWLGLLGLLCVFGLPAKVDTATAASSVRTSLIDSLLTAFNTHQPDRVDSLSGPAIATARAADDSAGLVQLLLIRGATRAGFGQARIAEADLRESTDLADALADTVHGLQGLRWLGVAVGRQGRAAEAAELYRELADRAEAAADSLHLGWAWVGLAYDHYLNGRAEAAGETYARAAGVLARCGETSGAIWARNGQGLALRQAGRYREARAAFADLLTLAEAGGDIVNQAMALDQLGRLDLMLGDPGRAVTLFRRSAEIHRTHHHRREELVPRIDMGTALIMQGRYAEAETTLTTVLGECRELGLRDLEWLAAGQLTDTELARGRPGAARVRCRRLLAQGPAPSRLSDTEARLRLVRALADQDSVAAAITVLQDLLADGPGAVSLELRTAGLLGALLVDDQQPLAAVDVLQRAVAKAEDTGTEAALVVLLTHLGRAEIALDRPDAALAAYARAIDGWEHVRTWPNDPVWREHRGIIAGSLFAQAVTARLARPEHPSDQDDTDALAAAWVWAQRHKARTLQERMLGPAAGTGTPSLPDLPTFQHEVLRPGEVFIDLIEGERLGVLFCVTRDTVFAGSLPGRRAVAPVLRRLGDLVRSPAVDDPEPARRLAADLLSTWPAAARHRIAVATSVTWSPDGSWHRLPAALIAGANAVADNDAGTTPATDPADPPVEWTRVPAAGVLARLRAAEQPGPIAPSIAAVAGPDPDGTGTLPGAAREIAWLESRFDRVRHLRPSASPERSAQTMGAGLSNADVLHLAAHTLLDVHQPWQTGITLADGPGGVLRATDVASLDLDAHLAVLAGCTTAGQRVIGGEGLIGLAGAFLAANTPAVLATLWPRG